MYIYIYIIKLYDFLFFQLAIFHYQRLTSEHEIRDLTDFID